MPSALRKSAFVAGASGAIGRILCTLLIEDGWRVVGTTRSPDRAASLRLLGVQPVIVDVFNRDALIHAVGIAGSEVVVHQLTDLPKEFDPESMAEARVRNAHIREVGTANLVAAATSAGAQRLVAQSIAFAYASGPRPHLEEAALDIATSSAVAKLEALVLGCPLEGIVLRYGRFYGPGTWFETPSGAAPVHVEAAADAARRAITHGRPGVYNVAEDDGTVSSSKAYRDLGWSPTFRVRHDREG